MVESGKRAAKSLQESGKKLQATGKRQQVRDNRLQETGKRIASTLDLGGLKKCNLSYIFSLFFEV